MIAAAELPIWIDALGWALLHSLWQAALIAGLYRLLTAWVDAPAWRVRLGELALASMLWVPATTLLRQLDPHSLPAQWSRSGAELLQHWVPSHSALASQSGSWLGLLVAAWCGGVLLLSLRLAWRWTQLQRLIGRAMPVAAEWQPLMRRAAARVGIDRCPRWLESDEVGAPLLVGWWRPVLLFPIGLCLRLPSDQVELLLAHELAHVRRHDGLGVMLQLLVETLLFFNPAVRWLSARVRHDREEACDRLVGGDLPCRLSYSRALLALAEWRQQHADLAMAATGGLLERRIERILLPATAVRSGSSGRRLLVSLLLGLLLLAGWQWWQLTSRPLPAPLRSVIEASLRQVGVATPAFDLPAPAWTPIAPPRPLAASPPPALAAPLPALGGQRVQPSTLAMAIGDLARPAAPMPQPLAVDAAPPAAAPARLLSQPLPEYPQAALRAGVEGFVVVSFSVGADGRAAEVEIEAAEPAGVFERAAERAVTRWRYAAAPEHSGRQLQRFDFTLDDQPPSSRWGHGCETLTGTWICREPRRPAAD